MSLRLLKLNPARQLGRPKKWTFTVLCQNVIFQAMTHAIVKLRKRHLLNL